MTRLPHSALTRLARDMYNCPTCGAVAGATCTRLPGYGEAGTPMRSVHAARKNLATARVAS
jgi:hypothetical protein